VNQNLFFLTHKVSLDCQPWTLVFILSYTQQGSLMLLIYMTMTGMHLRFSIAWKTTPLVAYCKSLVIDGVFLTIFYATISVNCVEMFLSFFESLLTSLSFQIIQYLLVLSILLTLFLLQVFQLSLQEIKFLCCCLIWPHLKKIWILCPPSSVVRI
jgi:hypothetical protein